MITPRIEIVILGLIFLAIGAVQIFRPDVVLRMYSKNRFDPYGPFYSWRYAPVLIRVSGAISAIAGIAFLTKAALE